MEKSAFPGHFLSTIFNFFLPMVFARFAKYITNPMRALKSDTLNLGFGRIYRMFSPLYEPEVVSNKEKDTASDSYRNFK